MAPHAGDRLGGYQLVELLGAGGMGEVWLARDEALARRVAVKLLPGELTRDPVRVSRFEQEARAASALNHPNVCTIHGLGLTAEGQRFIAMEHVEGQTLRQRLTTTRLSIRAALDIAIQIASALSAAHSATATTNAIRRSPRWQPGAFSWGPEGGVTNTYVELIGPGEPIRLTKSPYTERTPMRDCTIFSKAEGLTPNLAGIQQHHPHRAEDIQSAAIPKSAAAWLLE